MKSCIFFLALALPMAAVAQHRVPQDTFNAIANEFSGEAAQENTRNIIQYHRIQGSPMMAEVAERVVLPKLKAAGLEAAMEQFPSDGQTKYGTFISPMGWEIRSGELWVTGVGDEKNFAPVRLCRFSDVPMCVSTYSKGGTWSGELVDVGGGTQESDYAAKEVRGKVALASGYAANVVRQAVLKRGAVGVVIYPAAGDRPDHPDMVRYNGIWTRASEMAQTSGGFQISRNQYEQLAAWMKQGSVQVRGQIDATLGRGNLTLVQAYIRGTEHPEREVMITGHLDHPKWSANDNASGSGTMMEMARALQELIREKKTPAPKLTLHFMWVPEYFGTMAYVSKHAEARRCGNWDDPRNPPLGETAPPVNWASQACIVANINMDMVGEDTYKTNSRFYFTHSPDSVPSFLDALLGDVTAQTREANLLAPTGTHNYWHPEEISYAQGSDHDVFLGLGVPATMLGHDPDWTHHTSEDKIDKTDASEFLRVGVLASTAAMWMGSAEAEQWRAAWLSTIAELQSQHTQRAQQLFEAGAAERGRRSYETNIDELAEVSEPYLRTSQDVFRNIKPADALKYQQPLQLHSARREGGATVARRVALLPFDASAFENLSADDKTWWQEQQKRFASDSEGLATKPNLDLLMFEAVNFMDGKRTNAEIADMLSAEYLLDIDEAWVNRMVGILASEKLLAVK